MKAIRQRAEGASRGAATLQDQLRCGAGAGWQFLAWLSLRSSDRVPRSSVLGFPARILGQGREECEHRLQAFRSPAA
jgi:hypothetical protein